MGVQATRLVVDPKFEVTVQTIVSGGASIPPSGGIGIVSILPAADEHRDADVQRAVEMCYEHARDNNLLNSSGSTSFVTSLDGGKDTIRTEALVANVITGDVGIMINGTERVKGARVDTEEAFGQLLDWMRENSRLFN